MSSQQAASGNNKMKPKKLYNKKSDKPLKIMYLNCNSISNPKLEILEAILLDCYNNYNAESDLSADLILMGETNRFDFFSKSPLSNMYQFSESTKRLAFLAKNSLNIQKLSDIQYDPQIDVTEEANNNLESSIKRGKNLLISNVRRKAAENFPYEVQTDLIKVETSREIHHIENIYITPDCRD